MYADLFLRCEVHGHTDLGSYIESPVTIVNLQHVHVGRHLTIASTLTERQHTVGIVLPERSYNGKPHQKATGR